MYPNEYTYTLPPPSPCKLLLCFVLIYQRENRAWSCGLDDGVRKKTTAEVNR